MQAGTLQSPVALFVFNRPGTTCRVFDVISKIRPAKLLLVADGPRKDKEGEAEVCSLVRQIITSVDWRCEVLENFSETNLGCQERMISGLNWVFSQVEEAIILEDDCLPDPSFFPFCQELLEKYRGDSRIAYISGVNVVGRYLKPVDSYYFSQIGGIWGWATWRSEWCRYERHLSDWPELRGQKMLEQIFEKQPKVVEFWTKIFDAMHENRGPNTWDYQWQYTGFKNNSLTIVPSVNLVANIGFGEGATHTIQADPRFILPAHPMEFPLKHPRSFIPLRNLDRRRVQDMLPQSRLQRVFKKVHRLLAGSV